MKYGIVISNEKAVIETLSLSLQELAHLKEAATVPESVQELLSRPADFVILDTSLEDLDPVMALKKLVSIQPSLPVIVLVPSIHSAQAGELKQSEAYAVIEKPFEQKEILDIVEWASERRQLLSEVEYLKASERQTVEKNSSPEIPGDPYFYREVLRRFSKVTSQVLDHTKLFDLSTEAITETFTTSKTIIFLLDQKAGKYKPISFPGYQNQMVSSLEFDVTDELPLWLSKHHQIILCPEISGTQEFKLHQQAESLEAEIVLGLFAQGKLLGILALGKKITGRDYSDDDFELLTIVTNYLSVAIENALLYKDIATNRAHNEKVLNSLKTGVVTIDSRGLITTFNKAAEEILELNPEEVTGEKIEILGSQFADLMLRTMSGKEEYRRHEIVSPVKKKPLGISTSTMLDENGNIDGALMVFADLSKIKSLEKQAQDFERIEFWTKVASRLAHEVKNPLVPIKTFAQLLPQRYQEKEFREEFYQIVNKEVDRLNNIITQLTKFAESPQPQKKPVDIHNLLEKSVKSLTPKFDFKKTQVVKELAAEKVVTPGDDNLLFEAFTNIIDNAINSIKKNGTITISTSSNQAHPNSFIEIVFRDNGKGMTKDELKDVFTPFLSSSTSGMGLGLPIAQRIIKDHNGSLKIQSTPGKGTLVTVLLPLDAKGSRR